MLVLPPFQRSGLGSFLLNDVAFGPHFAGADDVYELTVEAPCPAFVALRDAVDLDRFIRWLQTEKLVDSKCTLSQILKQPNLTSLPAWSEAFAVKVQSALRMTRAQARRCFEALQLAQIADQSEVSSAFAAWWGASMDACLCFHR